MNEEYYKKWRNAILENTVQPKWLTEYCTNTSKLIKDMNIGNKIISDAVKAININNSAIAHALMTEKFTKQQQEMAKALKNILPPANIIKSFSKANELIFKNVQKMPVLNINVKDLMFPLNIKENTSALLRSMSEAVVFPSDLISFDTVGLSDEDERELENLLEILDLEYVRIRRASWDAFNSGETERLSHAMISMRRLFDFVLDEIQPREGEDDYRRNRVERALDIYYDEEFIKSLADMFKESYKGLQYLHGQYHRKHIGIENFRTNVKFYLRGCEWTLLFMLSSSAS